MQSQLAKLSETSNMAEVVHRARAEITMANNPKKPGLNLDSSPERLAALRRLLGTTVVKVETKFNRVSK